MSGHVTNVAGWPLETRLFLAGGGLALLAAPFAAGWLPPTAWLAVLAAAVALAGLPHGALDPWIAHRAGVWQGTVGFAVFNLGYLAAAAAAAALWLAWPGPMLALFLAYAAWHFAADWGDTLGAGYRLLAGVGLIALPAVFHAARIAEIFAILAGDSGATVARALAWAGPAVILGHGIATGVALARAPRVAAELALIGALAITLPPLAYFGVYFCLLHSSRHLRNHLPAPDSGRRRALVVAASYTLATVALAGLVAYTLGSGVEVDTVLLRLIFIGLAALTVPHMLLTVYVERRAVHAASTTA
jgi:Brp/Blh family beta-carotene 15,15'-monooxygenase